MTAARLVTRLAGLAVVLALGVGCGTGHGGATTAPSTATQDGSGAPAPAPAAAPVPLAQPSLDTQEVADPGPASVYGAQPTPSQVKRLIQFFENRVNHAYATGDADALSHYLAGPMLSGNRATVLLLDKQHKHDVVRVAAHTVKILTSRPHQVIARMTARMTADYFVDTRTGKVLDDGLPGPSPVQFVVFLDQNPHTHTWYWTGEQAGDSSPSAAGTGG